MRNPTALVCAAGVVLLRKSVFEARRTQRFGRKRLGAGTCVYIYALLVG